MRRGGHRARVEEVLPEPLVPVVDPEPVPPPSEISLDYALAHKLYRIGGPGAVRKRFTAEQLHRLGRAYGVSWTQGKPTKADMIAALFG